MLKSCRSWSGNACGRGERNKAVLRRLVRYSEQLFGLSRDIAAKVSDQRRLPRIVAPVVVKSVLAMFWARLGSLHALESVAEARFWKSWLEQPLASVDTVGRVYSLLEVEGLRTGITISTPV